MAKSSTDAEQTVQAPKKTPFTKGVAAYNKLKEKQSEEAKNVIAAVENVHAGVFKTMAKLDKMDAVKRGEWLFHFDIAREFYDWAKAEPALALSDRPASGGATPVKGDDDKRDLRPRHLRQPDASAESATATQLNPPRRSTQEAADAAEKNLSQVGRGPVEPDPGTKH